VVSCISRPFYPPLNRMGEPESVCMIFSRREKCLFLTENQETVFPFLSCNSVPDKTDIS
jgi:hypothetical protein